MSSGSTGGTEGSSPASSPASAASLTMAAPKYGTLVPNRIFVGGISASTSEAELAQLFSAYGNVKATKIISDRAGVSKGYGFVTFETEEEAKRLQQESECIVLRERKLNIAPAIKKQPFNRSFDGGSGSPPSVPTSTFYYTNGMGLAYQNGMTFYNTAAPAPGTPLAPPTDPATIYQAAGVFGPQAATGHQTFAPVMYPCPAPSLYMPQQYQYSPMPYEPYYASAAATGAPQFLYTTNNSQSNTSGSGSNSGSGNNGTGATSPQTGPPPPLPSLHPPPAHFYAPAAPPPHHHPPVPTGPPPPQVDHLYYPFAAGPPPAPHAPMGLTDQQLLLYTTDSSCQQSTASDNQNAPQEDSRSTSSHSEQPHGETQTASGSATPLVPLMPVKFPISGRYTNYHPIAIHTTNMHNSQSCLNESDDCTGNQMHCRTILYHPTVYIPHAHTPPFHNTTGGASLLPTPPTASQPPFETNTKTQHLNARDYVKSSSTNAPGNYVKSQNHNVALIHHNTFAKSQTLGNPRSHKYSNADGSHRYPTIAMTSTRLPVQYNKRNAGSNMGSPACYQAQRSNTYSTNSNLQKSHYTSNMSVNNQTYGSYSNSKTGNASQSFDYERKNASYNTEYHLDNTSTGGNKSSNHNSTRRNTSNNYRNSNSVSSSIESSTNGNQTNESYNQTQVDGNASAQDVQNTIEMSTSSDKPTSPPPAPYSPMTRPLPTNSPTPQVQFYAQPQNRYQHSLTPSQHQSQQQQQQQQSSNQRRYATVGTPISSNRKPAEKYSSAASQATVLRQSKYKVNGIMQTGNKVSDDSLGGAGDAPPNVGRMPITPPGTPRTHSASDQNQLNETCHQMQALSL